MVSIKHVFFLLTPNCNLSCKYCFQLHNESDIQGEQYHAQSQAKASMAIVERFAEFCAENCVSHVDFFGGEPLLYRELFHAAAKEILNKRPETTIGIVTNGTMIDEDTMQLIETHGVSVLLSLDGCKTSHDFLRGGFDRIYKWFPRLSRLKQITIAMQAAIIPELADNVKYIWGQGFRNVFLNIVENYGWYKDTDVFLFEKEYEQLIQAMLQGKGILVCAINIHDRLKRTKDSQSCGITGLGLACDWRGVLYPCQRAVELGPKLAIGDIFNGIDSAREQNIRRDIEEQCFRSISAQKYSHVSYCPISIYQQHQNFSSEWNPAFCEIIETKIKLVAKYFHDISKLQSVVCKSPALNHQD